MVDVLNAFLSANGLSAYIAAFADNEYDSLDDILEGVVGEESESALVREIAADCGLTGGKRIKFIIGLRRCRVQRSEAATAGGGSFGGQQAAGAGAGAGFCAGAAREDGEGGGGETGAHDLTQGRGQSPPPEDPFDGLRTQPSSADSSPSSSASSTEEMQIEVASSSASVVGGRGGGTRGGNGGGNRFTAPRGRVRQRNEALPQRGERGERGGARRRVGSGTGESASDFDQFLSQPGVLESCDQMVTESGDQFLDTCDQFLNQPGVQDTSESGGGGGAVGAAGGAWGRDDPPHISDIGRGAYGGRGGSSSSSSSNTRSPYVSGEQQVLCSSHGSSSSSSSSSSSHGSSHNPAPAARSAKFRGARRTGPHEPPCKVTIDMLNAAQRGALDRVMAGENCFITGSGGVGKSLLVKILCAALFEQSKTFYCVAPTGVAAAVVGGTTIHSFMKFGIPRTLNDFRKCWGNKEAIERIRTTDVLIIDEVSMLSGEMLDFLELTITAIRCYDKCTGGLKGRLSNSAVEREVHPATITMDLLRERWIPPPEGEDHSEWAEGEQHVSRLPLFGGMQVVCCGDFFQLPPIANKEDRTGQLFKGVGVPYVERVKRVESVEEKVVTGRTHTLTLNP